MSLRVDTNPLISGSLVVGDTGLGVLGSEVPSNGEAGAGYLYNDLSLPADAGKEVRGEIVTWPTLGDLTAQEDSSFVYDGLTDQFQYDLYVDGVADPFNPATVYLIVGQDQIIGTIGAIAVAGVDADISTGESQIIVGDIGIITVVGVSAEIVSAYVITSASVNISIEGSNALVSAYRSIWQEVPKKSNFWTDVS